MAKAPPLNAKALEALGAERLAAVLLDISEGDVGIRRRLRLEVAGAAGGGDVAKEIRKRLATIARARTFIDWQNRKLLVSDLDTQRRAIVEHVGKVDPAEAVDLLWIFMGLADSIFARCDDSSGQVIGVFHAGLANLGTLAIEAKIAPDTLVNRIIPTLQNNGFGQFDGLIETVAPALGAEGLEQLRLKLTLMRDAPQPPKPAQQDRKVAGWSSSRGAIYADEFEERHRQDTLRHALREIADIQGDADAFAAQYDAATRKVPLIAAGIAERLLKAGRADEALVAADAIDQCRQSLIPAEWEEMRAGILDALGRKDDARAFRWECFERSLNPAHLKGIIKSLPDFEDMEAADRAMVHALTFPEVHQALAFLVNWPAIEMAAKLVLNRAGEIDGDHYELLVPASEMLEDRHPLAATLLKRKLIDFALDRARVKRYRHAARHLSECADLANRITDFGTAPAHEVYVASLRAKHGKKSGFWSEIGGG